MSAHDEIEGIRRSHDVIVVASRQTTWLSLRKLFRGASCAVAQHRHSISGRKTERAITPETIDVIQWGEMVRNSL